MKGFGRRQVPAALLWLVGLGVLGALWLRGADYYRLALTADDARFDHARHEALRASGDEGHLLGIAAGLLILVNLAYLLRRHVRFFQRRGSLRAWMLAHVFTGLLSFGLVLLHATFHAGNVFHWLAVGSLGLLVLTGILGRLIYALVARDRDGRELTTGDMVLRLIDQGLSDEEAIHQAVARKERARRFLTAWRELHRPMAMLMATAATAHVATAILSRWEWLATDPGMVHVLVFSITGAVLAAFVGLEIVLVRRRRRRAHRDLRTLVRSELRGLNIPPSLNPVVDCTRCMGSAACVAACPEGGVLGLVNGQAHLIQGARCVGHGRCEAECPTGAITLVFGSARRGVDIPHVSGHFETNVPGVYITGELGGMGLIQNAVRQSLQALDHIRRTRPRGGGDVLDLLIVGAGPAGMAAALAARQHGLTFEIVDQEALGGSIQQYPRQKVVMTAPFELPGYGQSRSRVISKEELLDLWQRALSAADVMVRTGEKVDEVRRADGEGGPFEVVTSAAGPGGQAAVRRARTVMLCVGRRGSPRKLGVPGEELPHVTYRCIEPDQYAGARVLVVGGGDSAIESALMLAEAGAESTLSYRQAAVTRVREENRVRFERAVAAGEVRFAAGTEVQRIREADVELKGPAGAVVLPADWVIVQAGGVLPLDLLKRIGVSVERKFGTA
jgi:thioredoxin reductase/Pyruvate/2-oxoacid:ferredoxin oxidoreductase delta subunit/uncharacterized integral membrane protein